MGSSPRGSLAICSNMPGPIDPCGESSVSQGTVNCLPWVSPLQMLSHAYRCPQLLPFRPLWFPLPPSLVSLHPLPPSAHSTPSALSPARMRSLIEAAQEQGVEFVFAISAGQDMVFSSAGDRLLLQQKLRQVPWAIPSSHCSQARGMHACVWAPCPPQRLTWGCKPLLLLRIREQLCGVPGGKHVPVTVTES